MVLAAVLLVPFPIPEQEYHAPQQLWGNSARLPDGSQEYAIHKPWVSPPVFKA